MNSRPLQPGDLCFINRDRAELNGVMVSLPSNQCILINRIPSGSLITFEGQNRTILVKEDYWRTELLVGGEGIFPERWLIRIDGNPDAESDQIKQEEPEEVTA